MTIPDLPAAQLDRIFPFHLVVDGAARVVALGPSARKLCAELYPGVPLSVAFDVEQPSAGALTSADGTVFVLAAKSGRFRLRGQIVTGATHTHLLATPWVSSLADLQKLGLTLSDFSVHDPVVDHLLSMQSQEVALEEAKGFAERLSQQRGALRSANRRLEAQFAATRALAEATHLDDAISGILASVAPALGVPWAVRLAEGDDGALVPAHEWSATKRTVTLRTIAADDPLTRALRAGGTLSVDALVAEGSAEAAHLMTEGVTSASCVPIGLGDLHAGVLAFYGDASSPIDREASDVFTDLGARLSQFLSRIRSAEQRDQQARVLEAQSLQLARARDAAVEASKLKSSFLASVSHELRTPLSGVVGMASLLLDGELAPPERELAEMLASSANGLRRIIDDILDFSKLDSGKVELESIEIDVCDLVEQVTAQFGSGAVARGVDLVCTLDPKLATPVLSDPTRLRQVLSNLVANAVKFTEVGHVHVRADLTRQGASHTVRFEVSDTGIGIDRANVARLFQPFVQGDGSTTRRFGGSGLGLAICRQLLDLLGGTIEVESAPGEGSTFRFSLPVRLAAEPAAAVSPLQGFSVLVADDDEASREAAKVSLEAAGASVTTATLAESTQLAKARPPVGDVALIGLRSTDERSMAVVHQLHRAFGACAVMSPPGGSSGALERASLPKEVLGHKPIRPSVVVGRVLSALGMTPDELAPPSRPLPPQVTARGRALVAEDDHVNQVITAAYLRRLGYEVDVVADGSAAVDAATRGGYALLVLDAHMPVMDGLSAARAVRSLPDDRSRVRIVALTAGATDDERARCMAAGMDDFVAKPATLERLNAAIKTTSIPPPDAAARTGSWGSRQWPTIDRLRLKDLLEVDGSGGVAREVVQLFRASIAQRLASAAVHLGTSSAGGVRMEAHAIKGASETVGATALAHLAKRIEAAAARGDLADIEPMLEEARSAFKRATEALDAALSTAPAD